MVARNLFVSPSELPSELVEELCRGTGHCRVERIVSRGHSSPPGFWYDQSEDEWVAVLQGSAALEFEGQPPLFLEAGDHVLIPARVRHRVARTAPHCDTVWLAVFIEGKA